MLCNISCYLMNATSTRITYRLMAVAAAAVLLSGCADSETTAPNGDGPVTVMVRNLFIGSDLEALMEVSTLLDVPDAGAQVWAEIQATDFEERAEALADEIAAARPHLVGLQEASLFRIQSPGDFIFGNLVSARNPVLDYLEILLAALERRGLSYRAVAISTGTDLEGPMRVAGGIDDLRLTDREVIIARSDVEVTDIRAENYSATQRVSPGGVDELAINLVKGWTSVDATVGGLSFRFVSTHLEISRFGDEVQLAQAEELLAALSGETLPTILVGDFNSPAGGMTTPTYGNLIDAGFSDVWDAVGSGEGFTCCQKTDLREPTSNLRLRVDLILVRGKIEVCEASVVGDEPGDRTPGGLWPSDHAGVVATLRRPTP